jgi:hypothetical protein
LQAISDFGLTNSGRFKKSLKKTEINFWRLGMGTLALGADERVTGVEVTEDTLIVALNDGRTISVPLAWYPRLANATAAQRGNWQVAGGGYGIHWPDIDEDLNTEGLLRGAPAPRVQIDATKK